MRQIFQTTIFGLLTFLLSCNTDKNKSTDDFIIPDPRLLDFKTSDKNIEQAIIKAQDYLKIKESEIDIKDFYLDSVLIHEDTVVLMVNHIDYYKEWRLMKEDERRQKELKAKGDTITQLMWVPPTGNWSGKDRTILYLPKKDSIIDIVHQ